MGQQQSVLCTSNSSLFWREQSRLVFFLKLSLHGVLYLCCGSSWNDICCDSYWQALCTANSRQLLSAAGTCAPRTVDCAAIWACTQPLSADAAGV